LLKLLDQEPFRDEHGSGLDRTGSGLKPVLAGSGLDRTVIILKIGGSGLDRTEKILVVIRFYRFAKWQSMFCHQWRKLCWDYFAIRTVSTPPFSTYNVEF